MWIPQTTCPWLRRKWKLLLTGPLQIPIRFSISFSALPVIIDSLLRTTAQEQLPSTCSRLPRNLLNGHLMQSVPSKRAVVHLCPHSLHSGSPLTVCGRGVCLGVWGNLNPNPNPPKIIKCIKWAFFPQTVFRMTKLCQQSGVAGHKRGFGTMKRLVRGQWTTVSGMAISG